MEPAPSLAGTDLSSMLRYETQDNSRRRLALSTLAWHVLVTSVETL